MKKLTFNLSRANLLLSLLFNITWVELFSRGEQQRERVDHRAVLRAAGHQAGHRERGPRPTQDIHRRRNTRQAGGAPPICIASA